MKTKVLFSVEVVLESDEHSRHKEGDIILFDDHKEILRQMLLNNRECSLKMNRTLAEIREMVDLQWSLALNYDETKKLIKE